MSFRPVSAPVPAPRLTRRGLLASSAAGLALLVAGCTSSSGASGNAVSDRQAAAMAAQARVQETLVAAYRAAAKADPGLAADTTVLAAQAGQQLDRLRAAAPGAATSSASRASASSSASAPGAGDAPVPPAGQDVRAWLAAQIRTAADSHAAACVRQTGARAALLGSITAGLRGQAGQLS